MLTHPTAEWRMANSEMQMQKGIAERETLDSRAIESRRAGPPGF
jgi:hypothetical protein